MVSIKHNHQYRGDIYGDNFSERGNYRYRDHNVKFSGDLSRINLKVLALSVRMI